MAKGTRYLFAAAALLFGAIEVAAAAPGENYYRHGDMMSWGGWFVGPIMMLLFVGLLVAAIVVALRLAGLDFGAGRRESDVSRALSILQERYARGEIDHEEYEERRRRLV